MAKVSFAIMAVRARSDNVERTLRALNVRVPVLYDDEGLGCWNNASRAFKAIQSGATHHVVMQDDIILCKNFVPTVTHLCELRPNSIMSLFSMRKSTREAVERDIRWVEAKYGVWGQAIVMPVSLIPRMFRWVEQHVSSDWYSEDARISLWMEHHKIPGYVPAPNIVEHVDGKSMLGHSTPLARKSRLFIGENTDGLSVDWTRGLETPLTDNLGNLKRTYARHLIP